MDNNVYCLDGNTGAVKWMVSTNGGIASSPAVTPDGAVYVGSGDGNLYALNAADGSTTWKFNTGAMVTSSPVVFNNVVVFGSDDKVCALHDARSGLAVLSAHAAREGHSAPHRSRRCAACLLVRQMVYAVSRTSGAKVWSFRAGDQVQTSPAVSNGGLIIVGSDDSFVYALESSSGNVVWKTPTGVCACVCACVRVCVRVCVRACVRVFVRVSVFLRACVFCCPATRRAPLLSRACRVHQVAPS
jgi:outer membrane protein assembly factor BamB